MAAATLLAAIGSAEAKSIDYKGTIDVRRRPGRTPHDVRGRVCEDYNRDSVCQRWERGVEGVLVSDGLHVTETDRRGRYRLPLPTAADEARGISYFVTEPRGYDVPVDQYNVPQFYYVHKPGGSPLGVTGQPFRFGGLAPTGALPTRINFPMVREDRCRGRRGRRNCDKFKVVVSGDTQPYSNAEIGYVRDTIARELAAEDDIEAVLIEGDVMGDDLSLYPRFKRIMSAAGALQYYVAGNHDLDFDATTDDHSFDTFRREWGPEYYSFDIGQVHFITLDDVKYPCLDEDNRDGLHGGCEDNIANGATYNGVVTQRQIDWIRNDLAHVPTEKLVVVSKHIPIHSFIDQNLARQMVDNVVDLYEALGCRRAEDGTFPPEDCERRLLALSGHTHTNEQIRPGETFEGWNTTLSDGGIWESSGPAPFPQLVAGAASGAWWSGDFNDTGVPESFQRLGAPRGYFILEFDGNQYSDVFKATDRAEDRQMSLSMQTPGFDAWYDSLLGWLRTPSASRNATPPVNINDLPDTRMVLSGEIASTKLVANIWNGSKASTVYVQFDGGAPVVMSRVQAGAGENIIQGVAALDPYALSRQMAVARYAYRSTSGVARNQGFELFQGSNFGSPADPQPLSEFFLTDQSQHVWKIDLPANLQPGVHTAKVATIDKDGQSFVEVLTFEVLDATERPPARWQDELFE